MSLLLLATAAVAAVNAPRSRAALPTGDRSAIATLATTAALGVLALLASVAGWLADALDLSTPTVRMAAGAVVALQGFVTIWTRPPSPDPALGGRAAAIVPVAFPVLLTPGLGLLTISGALDRSAPVTIGVLAVALATFPAVAVLGSGAPAPAAERAVRAAGALLGGVLVVSGLGLVWNGAFDI